MWRLTWTNLKGVERMKKKISISFYERLMDGLHQF